jgi:hypothetical protein
METILSAFKLLGEEIGLALHPPEREESFLCVTRIAYSFYLSISNAIREKSTQALLHLEHTVPLRALARALGLANFAAYLLQQRDSHGLSELGRQISTTARKHGWDVVIHVSEGAKTILREMDFSQEIPKSLPQELFVADSWSDSSLERFAFSTPQEASPEEIKDANYWIGLAMNVLPEHFHYKVEYIHTSAMPMDRYTRTSSLRQTFQGRG